ncbi:hypothetical protein, partial [Clostridium perfringens]|uniref:hypothetical protein n=1 Tax=Clostridium perfringens TaxID=1502 RepID=UPI003753ED38
ADQGCEKKGITEKIKQKIPGVGGNEKDPRHTPTTVGNQPMGQQTTYGQQNQGEHCGQEEHEKKGIMDKIKEKLPGGGHSREA